MRHLGFPDVPSSPPRQAVRNVARVLPLQAPEPRGGSVKFDALHSVRAKGTQVHVGPSCMRQKHQPLNERNVVVKAAHRLLNRPRHMEEMCQQAQECEPHNQAVGVSDAGGALVADPSILEKSRRPCDSLDYANPEQGTATTPKAKLQTTNLQGLLTARGPCYADALSVRERPMNCTGEHTSEPARRIFAQCPRGPRPCGSCGSSRQDRRPPFFSTRCKRYSPAQCKDPFAARRTK